MSIFDRIFSRKQNLIVNAVWDAEASVWVATSDDVPGLVTEAATVAILVEKLQVLIPELLEENRSQETRRIHPDIPVSVNCQQTFQLRVA